MIKRKVRIISKKRRTRARKRMEVRVSRCIVRNKGKEKDKKKKGICQFLNVKISSKGACQPTATTKQPRAPVCRVHRLL